LGRGRACTGRLDRIADRWLGDACKSHLIGGVWLEPCVLIFCQRNLPYGTGQRQSAGDFPQDRPCRDLFSHCWHVHSVLCERIYRLLAMGHVEHYLVSGGDRDHRKSFLHPRAALVERGNLSGDGLALYWSRWSNARGSTYMGHRLANCRRRDLYPRRSGLYYKDIQLQAWRIWIPRNVAYLRDARGRGAFCGGVGRGVVGASSFYRILEREVPILLIIDEE
jgi:hypothetical protein